MNGKHRGEDHADGGRPGFGGAIYSQGGTLILAGCTLTSNSAIGGNALASESLNAGGSGSGGAIFNEYGTLRIASSIISSNTAAGGLGAANGFSSGPAGNASGGAILSLGGIVTVVASQLADNTCNSPASGSTSTFASGGAFDFNNTTANISDCIVRSNHALGSEGNSNFNGLRASGARGGALRSVRGGVQITHSEITGNAALAGGAAPGVGAPALGGAIYSEGLVSIFYTTVASNIARGGFGKHGGALGAGGAWYISMPAVASESLFIENVARGGEAANFFQQQPGSALGGAIYNENQLLLTNCTLALNLALAGNAVTASLPAFAAGGAIYNPTNSSLRTMNVTIASNSVQAVVFGEPNGSAFGANLANDNGVAELRNTILAYPNSTNSNVHGLITDGGHNISKLQQRHIIQFHGSSPAPARK